MVNLRKSLPELVYGSYKLVDKDNPNVYAYTRILEDRKVLVMLNFTDKERLFRVPVPVGIITEVLINNLPEYKTKGNIFYLQPYQALIARLK